MSEHVELTGREPIVAELVRAVGSRSTFIVLEGRSGSGKTALLDTVLERFRQSANVDVRQLHAVPWESSIAGGVLRQLFPGVNAALAECETFEARLDAVLSSTGVPTSHEPSAVVVAVDDAEHADVDSLELLASVVRFHRDRAVAVICCRTLGTANRVSANNILDRAADVTLPVRPLGPVDVADMAALRGIVLTQSAATQLTRHTGGRPRHIAALLDELDGDAWNRTRFDLPAPSFLSSAVRESLAEFDDDTRRLCSAVAVLGAPASVHVALQVARIEVEPWAAVDAAERAGLIRVERLSTSTVLACPDAMIRAGILAALGRVEQADLHRTAAGMVEDPASVLAHLVEVTPGPDSALSDKLEALAVERAGKGEWAAAANLYSLASRSSGDTHKRDDRLVLAVDALIGAGDVPTASGYVAEIESFRETAMRSAVLGYLAIMRGRPQEAGARLDRAWEMVRVRHEPDVAAVVCHRQVLHNLARCNGTELVKWADRAIELVGTSSPTAIEAQSIRGLGLGGTGHVVEALRSYKNLWSYAHTGAVGQRVQIGSGWLHLATDQIDIARVELESATPTDFLGGSTRISLWAHSWLARTYFVTGDWGAALRIVDSGVDLASRSGAALMTPLLRWTSTQIHALRGDWNAASESARAGDAGAREYEIMRVPAALGRAAIAEARADYAGVLRALGPLTEAWAQGDVSEPGFWPWQDVYANALVIEGRLSEADVFLSHHEERAVSRGHKSALARLSCARGRWHGARNELNSARICFEEALASLASLPLIYDRARVNYVYGLTLRRAGKRREADVVITAAREDYSALGAATYVARCDRELKAGGMNAVLKDRSHDTLTPQEEAVAGLVATGMTNREVAAELFLSVKTVQFHLTRVYSKLGIRSRAELAARASGSGDAAQ
ncbi:AAA family ATPase [Rhodococcus sp. BP-252]|uniref:helix-turn-helix transcriptional regulator n=1 Tax=unclassified Rhodococcus (in: high G+C Gram-positive bacteria) TaxID=192944 RepID=UPI001C9B0363|nr:MULTISPECIES: LuxR family transcriptional regulator [unclassified Rhodococcus (in: high G+C Gram-positive bacteria)]MBY6412808.1 AAA family ATPase [Rhodococcus sp. BP-320]MBY6417655.1 AAA family ATPase [Rhodococcus sp. BP-321]MBY6423507.1 AAA family ATPase [Rhodococcus sp. BP-324]MBY6427679.1 AAA family ATPase [Rhodococcus sp. BP-323]MBY6432843.1 AAA family ATPase [Rhodococcus sp. BP-322]